MGAELRDGAPHAKRLKLSHEHTVEVSIGGRITAHPSGTTAGDAMGGAAGAVAARLDNVIVPLSQPIVASSVHLEPVVLASSDGIRTLVETLKCMVKIAKHNVLPGLAIIVGRPIGAAYYCMLEDKTTGEAYIPTEENLRDIQNEMESLISAAHPLTYMTIGCQQALDQMRKTGAGLSAKIFADCTSPHLEVVQCCDLYHLPRAPVMPNTSMVSKDSFKLTKFKDGFFLQHPRFDPRTGEAKHAVQADAINDMLYNEYKERLQWTRDVGLHTVAQLNAAIRDGLSKKVIQAAEANCDRQFVELAAAIKSRADVKLVLIAGPSSSGKTTFAKRLQVQLESLGFKPEVLSVDNFYKGWPDINKEGAHKVDWESLDSLNLDQLNEVLLMLLSGKEAVIPEYDMKTSMPADRSRWTKMQLSPGKSVVIMEGIHCLNPALTAAVPKSQKFQIAIAPIPALQLDATHVLSGTTIRMLRRMVRDYLNRGRPVLTTLRQWPSIAAGEVNNIYPHQGNADAVMNSEIAYEMSVLKVHVEPLLNMVKSTEPEYSEVRRLLDQMGQFTALPTNIIPAQSLLREFIGGSWYYDYGGWYKSY